MVFHSTSRINPAAAAFAAHLLWDLGIGNFAKSIAHRSNIEGGVSELVTIVVAGIVATLDFVAPETAILGVLVQVVASLQTDPLYFFGMEGSI